MPKTKKTVVPRLRFPEFRNAEPWEVKRLGEITVAERSNLTMSQIHSPISGSFPVYGADGIVGYRDTFQQCSTCISIVKDGAGVGRLMLVPGPASVLSTLMWLKPTDLHRISMSWLFYAITSLSLMSYIVGSGIPHLYFRDIAAARIALPQREEQQKIADCLSSLDELIELETKRLEALKAHKKGLLQQLFPREGETRPRLRFPEFCNAPEWTARRLGDACSLQAGMFVRASEIKDQYEVGLYPCYGGNGLRGYTATFTHDGAFPLVGRQGALCGNVKFCTGKFHTTEHALVATPKTGIDVKWLYYALDFLNLNRFATGQAQPGLSVDVLEKVHFSAPDKVDEQHRIAACLSSLDDLIAAQSERLEALRAHKRGLMQQLFPQEI